MAKPLRLTNEEAQKMGLLTVKTSRSNSTNKRMARHKEHDRRRSLSIQAQSDAKAREIHLKKIQKQALVEQKKRVALQKKQAAAIEKVRQQEIRVRLQRERQQQAIKKRNALARNRAITKAVHHTERSVRRGARKATRLIFHRGW